MLTLLASVAILAGVGSSHHMGEVSPFPLVAIQAQHKFLALEGEWDNADKVENGSGWSLRGSGDLKASFLTIGGGYSYRHTDTWSKEAWWIRAGIAIGPVWLLASMAPTSSNEERKIELRYTLRHKWLEIQPRAWIGDHSTSDELGGPSYGLEMLIGGVR